MNALNGANLSVVQLQRHPDGRFLPGSGGRPVGAKAKASRQLLQQVKELGPSAIEKLRAALDKGERWAVEIVLSHVLPRERAIEFEGTSVEDVAEALRSGDITATEAKDVAATLAKLSEINDVAEIKARLAELEAALAERK